MLQSSSLRPFLSLFLRLVLMLSLGLSPFWEGQEAWAASSSSTQNPSTQDLSGHPQSAGAKNASRSSASSQKKKAQSAKGKTAPHASARHMGAALGTGSSWYLDGTPQAGRGAVWERGIPMENLSRKRTLGVGGAAGAAGAAGVAGASGASIAPAAGQVRELGATRRNPQAVQAAQSSAAMGKGGVDTTKGIDSALGEISSYERQPADGSALGLKKPGVPSVQMTTEESSWRNPVTQPHAVGQEVMTTRRNVVGAYADVVKSDDLHVTLGPELHIPETDGAVKHLSPQQNESSTLGFGMKWQWDF